MEDPLKKYDEELMKYEGVEARYESLISEKQRLLINEDTPRRHLRSLLNKLNELKLILRVNKPYMRNAYNALLR